MVIRTVIGSAMLALSLGAQAAPVFMSSDWAAAACAAWNGNEQLVAGLGGDWIKNDAGRGYKAIHIYRDECASGPRVELTIQRNGDRAECSYGGAVQHSELNGDVDYLMHATDDHWVCMGKGEWGCGPMGAMATGKLKFEGPKMEAMSVMGPFEGFLLLTGAVDSDRGSCPN
ncbi:MAG: SCP2 sterol-binding domain-containing protein [Gammaproteobacteria bacterium]|nr:SCP2 sterol-binding domain-containing protein [Gammaproteobacteria bacterium]